MLVNEAVDKHVTKDLQKGVNNIESSNDIHPQSCGLAKFKYVISYQVKLAFLT